MNISVPKLDKSPHSDLSKKKKAIKQIIEENKALSRFGYRSIPNLDVSAEEIKIGKDFNLFIFFCLSVQICKKGLTRSINMILNDMKKSKMRLLLRLAETREEFTKYRHSRKKEMKKRFRMNGILLGICRSEDLILYFSQTRSISYLLTK